MTSPKCRSHFVLNPSLALRRWRFKVTPTLCLRLTCGAHFLCRCYPSLNPVSEKPRAMIWRWRRSKRESALREEYETQLPDYQNKRDAWQKQREQILRERKSTLTVKEANLREIGPGPIAPLEPMVVCPEPTFEGLCECPFFGRAYRFSRRSAFGRFTIGRLRRHNSLER